MDLKEIKQRLKNKHEHVPVLTLSVSDRDYEMFMLAFQNVQGIKIVKNPYMDRGKATLTMDTQFLCTVEVKRRLV